MTVEQGLGSGCRDVLARCQEALSFLEGDRQSRLVLDSTGDRTVRAYVGERLTIEVELDWREGSAFILICRTVRGGRPPGYYVHEGQRVRLHLAEALQRFGDRYAADITALRAATSRTGPDAMIEQVGLGADVLRRSYSDIRDRLDVLMT